MTIPSQFIDYLGTYSHGGIAGVEILGVGLNGAMVFVEATLRARTYGLPKSLLVVENCDEWLYCIDCSNGTVVSWEIDGEVKREFASSKKAVRAVWDDKNSCWLYSAVDVVSALVGSSNPRVYWNTLKTRNSQLSTFCRQLKLTATDGKRYEVVEGKFPFLNCLFINLRKSRISLFNYKK